MSDLSIMESIARLVPHGSRVLDLGCGDGAMLDIERDTSVGHKVAARPIDAGDVILKYNCPIGIATQAIAAGAYVHTHNVKSGYLPTYTLPA